MKFYIGNQQIQDDSYVQIPDPSLLEHLADDAECTVIILADVLRKYNLDQIRGVLQLCRKKLRLGGILKIVDVDFDLLIYVYGQLNNIVDLNAVFMQSEVRSLLNLELITEIMKSVAPDTSEVHFSRTSNIQFDVEFMRK